MAVELVDLLDQSSAVKLVVKSVAAMAVTMAARMVGNSV